MDLAAARDRRRSRVRRLALALVALRAMALTERPTPFRVVHPERLCRRVVHTRARCRGSAEAGWADDLPASRRVAGDEAAGRGRARLSRGWAGRRSDGSCDPRECLVRAGAEK